jgi:hypothetical protein
MAPATGPRRLLRRRSTTKIAIWFTLNLGDCRSMTRLSWWTF